ncbi:MAG: hypothetical protein HYT80_08590 [Euryarchaeota archaeon]|nr:hypothetical protein [Euryarchaeota archaeon]
MNTLLIVGVASVVAATGAAVTAHQLFFLGDEIIACEEAVVPFEEGVHQGQITYVLHAPGTGHAAVCVYDEEGLMRWKDEGPMAANKAFTRTTRVPLGVYTVSASVFGDDVAATDRHVDLERCEGHAYLLEFTVTFEPDGVSMEDGSHQDCESDSSMGAEVGRGEFAESDLSRTAGAAPISGETLAGGGAVIAAGAAGAGATLATIYFWPQLKFALLGFFTRLARPRILDQDVRGRIHELVTQEPGIHGHAVATQLEIGNGQAAYHLRVLVREGVLSRVGVFGSRSYFVAGRNSPAQMRALAALRRSPLRTLYEDVVQHPGEPLARSAQRIGLSLPRVSRLARRLGDVGLVERTTQGRSVVLRPTRLVASR